MIASMNRLRTLTDYKTCDTQEDKEAQVVRHGIRDLGNDIKVHVKHNAPLDNSNKGVMLSR